MLIDLNYSEDGVDFGFARRSIYPELQIERFFRNRVIFSHYGLTGSCICAHPEIRAWEECHEMTKLCRQVARISNQREANAPRSFRDVGVVGINHFTFVTGIRLGGRNMMTDWAEFLAAADYLQDAAGWGFARTPVAFRVRDRATKRAKVGAMVEGGLAAVPRRFFRVSPLTRWPARGPKHRPVPCSPRCCGQPHAGCQTPVGRKPHHGRDQQMDRACLFACSMKFERLLRQGMVSENRVWNWLASSHGFASVVSLRRKAQILIPLTCRVTIQFGQISLP